MAGPFTAGELDAGDAASRRRENTPKEEYTMPRVTTIPATKNLFTALPTASVARRKVAGYARVSTDSDEQFTSYEAQIDYYTRYIMEREDWQFVKVYTDEYNGKTIQLSGVSAPHKHKKTALRVDITPGAIFLRL